MSIVAAWVRSHFLYVLVGVMCSICCVFFLGVGLGFCLYATFVAVDTSEPMWSVLSCYYKTNVIHRRTAMQLQGYADAWHWPVTFLVPYEIPELFSNGVRAILTWLPSLRQIAV